MESYMPISFYETENVPTYQFSKSVHLRLYGREGIDTLQWRAYSLEVILPETVPKSEYFSTECKKKNHMSITNSAYLITIPNQIYHSVKFPLK